MTARTIPKERPVNDYPLMIATVNRVEPVPRRIRAILAGETVLDTIRARYVWEWPNYPQYYVPITDVRRDLLVDEHRRQHSPLGAVEAYGLRVGNVHRPNAAKMFTESSVNGLSGTIRFDWATLDAWFEANTGQLRPPRPDGYGDLVPLQREYHRLLVGPGRRDDVSRPGVGIRLSHPRAVADRGVDLVL
jgi:uncharacterized protein (DUF427 family)